MTRHRPLKALTATMLAAAAISGAAIAQDALDLPAEVTLFKNVMVFDGVTDGLQDLDVLVVRNKIHRVEADIPEAGTWEVEAENRKATKTYAPVSGDFSGYSFEIIGGDDDPETLEVAVNVIDGGGRTLMPGLIDSHTHFTHCLPGAGLPGMEDTPWQRIGAMATVCAKEHLGVPHLNRSTVMFRKRRTENGEQAAQAGGNRSEVAAG